MPSRFQVWQTIQHDAFFEFDDSEISQARLLKAPAHSLTCRVAHTQTRPRRYPASHSGCADSSRTAPLCPSLRAERPYALPLPRGCNHPVPIRLPARDALRPGPRVARPHRLAPAPAHGARGRSCTPPRRGRRRRLSPSPATHPLASAFPHNPCGALHSSSRKRSPPPLRRTPARAPAASRPRAPRRARRASRPPPSPTPQALRAPPLRPTTPSAGRARRRATGTAPFRRTYPSPPPPPNTPAAQRTGRTEAPAAAGASRPAWAPPPRGGSCR